MKQPIIVLAFLLAAYPINSTKLSTRKCVLPSECKWYEKDMASIVKIVICKNPKSRVNYTDMAKKNRKCEPTHNRINTLGFQLILKNKQPNYVLNNLFELHKLLPVVHVYLSYYLHFISLKGFQVDLKLNLSESIYDYDIGVNIYDTLIGHVRDILKKKIINE